MMDFRERYQRLKQVFGSVANAPEIRTREKLVRAEKKRAWDANAANDANADEKRAAIIIQGLREFERRVVFGDMPCEAVPSPQSLDMGGQFLTNRIRVQKYSILFNYITKKVPKGAILHLHFNTVLGPELLLKQARLMDNMFVWSKRALLEEADLQATEMMFKVLPCNTESNSVFSKDFKPESDSWKKPECNAEVWMRWNEFRTIFQKTFPGQCRTNMNENGQLDSAENWILQKMVLNEAEVYAPGQTLNGYAISPFSPLS
jgi:adenosine deaminase CECR1